MGTGDSGIITPDETDTRRAAYWECETDDALIGLLSFVERAKTKCAFGFLVRIATIRPEFEIARLDFHICFPPAGRLEARRERI
jgi:hypothetical protein